VSLVWIGFGTASVGVKSLKMCLGISEAKERKFEMEVEFFGNEEEEAEEEEEVQNPEPDSE